jgi:GWxTD domain-containing protein
MAVGLVLAGALHAAEPAWLNSVAPIITSEEKRAYKALSPEARGAFEEQFWSTRSIDRDEYYRRLEYIDSKFGSSKRGSGANTDPGRIYLSLGPPTKITRIPSSRIFVPLEIWYYDSVPQYLNTELRLIFYQPNGVGLPKLYSPGVDTIRALLLPEASAAHLFGPNDSVTESDVRQVLKTGPAEDEVITAAADVATGIKYSGNDEILGRIASPAAMLSRAPSTLVTSRFIVSRPQLDVLRTASYQGAAQIDLRLLTNAQRDISLEVFEGAATVYSNRLNLKFPKSEPIGYTHRLDVLPGSYRLIFTVDAKTFAYPLEVPEKQGTGDIERAEWGPDVSGRHTPFEFAGRQITLNPTGRLAIIPVAEPGTVTWFVRQAGRIVWRSVSEGQGIAVVEFPPLPPGSYKLEAVAANDSRTSDWTIPAERAASNATLVSFNANLAPERRLAFIGNQWLRRGRFDRARETLNESLAKNNTKEGQIALARVDALSGNLDAARDRVRAILARSPDDFEALSVFAYIETKFQDYSVAAELYRRALAVQDSPAVRMALRNLPDR